MKRVRDLYGQQFGRLTAIRRDWAVGPRLHWICLCSCGKEVSVRLSHLRSGATKSCGCYGRELAASRLTTHGHGRGGQLTPEYRAFRFAKSRCTTLSNVGWKNYGGRGIKFLFTSLDQFIADIGPKPTPTHTVDRINNNGHYEPGNVRWATPKEQCQNRRQPSRKIKGDSTAYEA